MSRPRATKKEIDRAREEYATDDIAIDDDAVVSRGEDTVWVQAWVLMSDEGYAMTREPSLDIPFEPFDVPPPTEKEKEQSACKDCTPEFDLEEVTRLKMSSHAIRKKYPRWTGKCPTCGYYGIKYACYEQYIYGDY